MNEPRWFSFAASVVLGLCISTAGWASERTTAPLVLLPVACLCLKYSADVFALLLTYMAVTTWPLVQGVTVFSDTLQSQLVQASAWLFLCSMVAGLWSLPHQISSRTTHRCVGIFIVQIALLLPPLWLLGVAHPIAAWGFLTPGAGALGLLIGVTLPQTIGGALRKFMGARSIGVLMFACGVLAIGSSRELPLLTDVDGIVAVNTRWGSPKDQDHPAIDRLPMIAKTIRQSEGTRKLDMVVFPETSLGVFSSGTDFLLRLELGPALEASEATIVLPMDRDVGGLRSSALVIDKNGNPSWLDARQPLPVALWRPWAEGSYSADWSRLNVLELSNGKRVWVSFCYEDVMPGFFLDAVLRVKPDYLVSVANNWFLRSDEGSAIQANSIEAMSRLFSVPLARAVNRRS